MENPSEITASLSPEKLALLQRRLRENQQRRNKQGNAQDRIKRRAGNDPSPLSFGQERMWFLSQLQPGNPVYNITAPVPLTGAVSLPALEWSLNRIIARHEALRTTFELRSGQPAQAISQSMEIPVALVEFSPADSGIQPEVQSWISRESSRPFDLLRGPLLRASLLRIGPAGPGQTQVLYFVFHHIVFDAWSMRVLLKELQEHYAAFSRGETASPLPELPIQYADFAVWQRERLQGDVLDNMLEYWLKQLNGAPSLLELPTDRPRPAIQTSHGALHTFSVPQEVNQRIKALCHRTRTTSFMTLLAGFTVLLHRYTGERDLLLGTPIANRGRSEVEGLIGFFLNTLVLRIDCSGDPTFLDLLGRIRRMTLEAFDHQELPFEKLVDAIRPDRNLSVNPLFQVMFVLQSANDVAAAPEPTSVPGSAADTTPGSARFDLTLTFVENADTLSGSLEYNTDLFDSSTIHRFAGHLGVLLDALSRNPEQRLSALPLLTEPERLQLAGWNSTNRELPSCQTIHELVERAALRTPEAIALTFEEQELTYRVLNARANQLARHLLGLGVRPRDLVGIFVERSPEMILGLLGILKAGAVYVPLDPAYPKESLAFMLKDASVATVVTQDRLVSDLPEHPARVIRLDTEWDQISKQSGDNLAHHVSAADPAYVIYTSGSTGRPKGVVVPHLGAVNCAEVETRMFEMRPQDRVLQFATLNFDASLYDMIVCWYSGATLCLARRENIIPGPELIRLLRDKKITVLPIPPSALAVLPVEALPDLRLITVMGESCPQELLVRWKSVPRFFNAYGPTETTMWVAGGYLDASRKPTIGRPIANCQIHLLDAQLREVPIGVPGEIHVGGVGVSHGYLHRPDLTAERFIPNPFATQPGQRLYKTGDIARYLANGEIDFLGRRDSQIKIRGYRVELGEIEAVLNQYPGTKDVLVLVRDDLATGTGIVAYVVGEPGTALESGELHRFLEQRLPRYMVPAAFVVLDSIPLSPSGKADRQSLPLPEAGTPARGISLRTPATADEATLARIWAEVLGLQQVDPEENFFELGGHSLLATQIVTRVRDLMGVDLPMRHLFESPTVGGLAAIIQGIQRSRIDRPDEIKPARSTSPSALISPPGGNVDDEIQRLIVGLDPHQKNKLLQYLRAETSVGERTCPASWGQERLWFLDQMEPGNPAYNLSTLLPMPAKTDVGALERALNEVVRRHESLRTVFRMEGGRPVQVITSNVNFELKQATLQAHANEDRAAEFQRLAADIAWRPFDLEKGPLFSATLVESDRTYVLLLTLHHIISDGWSTGILVGEIMAIYDAFTKGQPSPLRELTAQYGDFVQWQRDRLQGKLLEESLAFWSQRLFGAPGPLELPLDYARPRMPSSKGAVEWFPISEGLLPKLAALAQREDASMFMTLLAVFDVFLWRHTGMGDILVGTPITNRSRSEFEPLIGFFVNTLVLRCGISPSMTFNQLLKQVRRETLEAYGHADVPFERLVEHLQPERNVSVNPFFQVMFALHKTASTSGERPQGTALPESHFPSTVKFDLVLNVVESKNGLTGAFEYKTDLFERSTILRMAASFQSVIESIAANPSQRLFEIRALSNGDLDFLAKQNDTATAYDLEWTLQARFERQADLTPDSVALIFEEEELTYAELNARANQVAHRLIALGAGPETRVAICMERSIEMMVGLWGILKAGGAYVPLDPSYPAERLAFMMKDSEAPILLSMSHLVDKLPIGHAKVLRLDDDWQDIAVESRANPPVRSTPDNLAYLIYTSGSTGQPKAVMIDHRAIGNRLLWMQDAYELTAHDRILQKTPLGFDVSVWELFWPLLVGAALVVARPEGHRDPSYLAGLIAARGVTHLHFVPSMLRAFLREPGLKNLRSLKRVICSGEELPADLQERFFEKVDAELHNLYGPTEAAVDVTSWACRPKDGSSIVPIGRPIANIRTYILGPNMEQMPIGVPGELYLGGVGLARGYRNRPGLTAERFIPNPFADRPGERLYRTGDRARFKRGGEIEFLGRLDRQVKIRGHRIELGEIEAALADHPAVAEAVVYSGESRGSESGNPMLIAYIVSAAESSPTREDLSSWLAQKLPPYMVPAHYQFLKELPLNSNGKLNLKALSPTNLQIDARDDASQPARSPVEEVLTAIFGEVLGIENVGVNQNFFQLGGHSLLALQVLSRMRESLNLKWPLTSFFESPTVESLVADIFREPERRALVEKRAEVWVRLSKLSDEEVQGMLGEES